MSVIKSPKKLIEVALPLDDINAACAYEKLPGIGIHPRGLHLWWARRPLSAARAVLFAQLVNDPGYQQGGGFKYGVNKEKATIEREKLFAIIRDLVKWGNTNNEEVLDRARVAIEKSWREVCALNKDHPQAAELFNPEQLPAFHDPFAGGGAIPLEAQRLGLEAYASDLNPVAVMINKAMIEIPPKFAGQKPIGPIPASDKGTRKANKDGFEDWSGAKGLAEDVRRYGHWMREEAFKRIRHLYPKVVITLEMAENRSDLEKYIGDELTVIAWLWTRTVKSPNPAFSHIDVPLTSNFVLSSRKGKEAWIKPIIEEGQYRFEVHTGSPPSAAKKGTKQGHGAKFNCLLSDTPIRPEYVKEEGRNGRIGVKLLAIVAEVKKGRIYLSPFSEMEDVAKQAKSTWQSRLELPDDPRNFWAVDYGVTTYDDLFTPRQLVALTTFSDLLHEARARVIRDAKALGMKDDGLGIDRGGIGATAYGDAVTTYLSFAVDRLADYNSSSVTWKSSGEQVMQTYKRQAIPMVWDFPESNVFGVKAICWLNAVKYSMESLKSCLKLPDLHSGHVIQADASTQSISHCKILSLDPPYYDNISYADLSDFFYVWLRRSLRQIYPNLFATMAVPKEAELVATPYRHGSKEKAEAFFMAGMTKAIHNLAKQAHPAFPVTIYYAFKQSETKAGSTSNTGWETFLEAVISAGFSIDGTWPMRTELSNRMISSGTNALASSIVLVCRKRKENVGTLSRRQFQRQLRREMPEALETMIGGEQGQSPIAPVDLAQAAIGPGMAIFSQYEAVLKQDGSAMSIHDALILINREITDYLTPDSGNFDADTLFCTSWFEQYAWQNGVFGEADTLARAKGTSVDGVHDANVIESGNGKVRLLKWAEYPSELKPRKDQSISVWEACHHLIAVFNQHGESDAGALLARIPEQTEAIRQLAYYLYTLCERKKWAEDARYYNELIRSWHAIITASHEAGHSNEQISMGF